MSFLKYCCCCIRRCYPKYDYHMRRLEKVQLVRKKLMAEKDFASYIVINRLNNILLKVFLKPYQKQALGAFESYTL